MPMTAELELPFSSTPRPDAVETQLQQNGKQLHNGLKDVQDRVTASADSEPVAETTGSDSESDHKPTGARFALLFACIMCACLIIGYDTNCVATLIPVITDQFNALQDLGWYTVANLLAQFATSLICGQLYSLYSMKRLFMASVAMIVISAVLSASAPTSAAFIVGRALMGWANAGMLAGITIIIANITSLKRRPIYLAVTGGTETAAQAFAPFIGGAINQYASWRVAIYIIIPVGVAVFLGLSLSNSQIRRPENAHYSSKDRLKRIDWAGFLLNIPMTICLVLGLQWGGVLYPWGDWRVILTLTLSGVLLIALIVVEHRAGENSMVPLKMLRQRSVIVASFLAFCNFAHFAVIAYYLPVYFQAVRGASTLQSGLMYLPTALASGVAGLAAGPFNSVIGYYNPTLLLGSVFAAVGAGLITTLGPDTSIAHLIGYQIIYGIGPGLTFSPPYLAVQTILDDSVVPRGLVMLTFTQQCGGVVILSVAQNVLLSQLARYLVEAVPGFNSNKVLQSGALGLVAAVPPEYRAQALDAYNKALTGVFYIVLALSCLAMIAALALEWRSMKKSDKK